MRLNGVIFRVIKNKESLYAQTDVKLACSNHSGVGPAIGVGKSGNCLGRKGD